MSAKFILYNASGGNVGPLFEEAARAVMVAMGFLRNDNLPDGPGQHGNLIEVWYLPTGQSSARIRYADVRWEAAEGIPTVTYASSRPGVDAELRILPSRNKARAVR